MVLFPWTKNMVRGMHFRLFITPLFLLYLSIVKKEKKSQAAVDVSIPEDNMCAVTDVFT